MSQDDNRKRSLLTRVLKEFKSLLILVVILVICFGSGYAWSYKKTKDIYDLLLKEKTALIEELKITKNKTVNLEDLLIGMDKDAVELRGIIKSLESREAEVEYVIKTETIIKRGKPKIIRISKCDLPPSHIYKLDNGLPVAQFKAEEDPNSDKRIYLHETADLKIKNSIVITEEETAVVVRAESSLEPNTEYVLKIDKIQTKKIKTFNTFEPHLMITMAGSFEPAPIGLDFTGNVTIPLIHIKEAEWDVLAPKIGCSDDSVRVGADLVLYNLGKELPVITDLWLGLGTSVDITSLVKYPSIDLSIGSKF